MSFEVPGVLFCRIRLEPDRMPTDISERARDVWRRLERNFPREPKLASAAAENVALIQTDNGNFRK